MYLNTVCSRLLNLVMVCVSPTICSTSYWGKLSRYDGSGYTTEISNDTL